MANELSKVLASFLSEHGDPPEALRAVLSGRKIDIPINSLLDSDGPTLPRDHFSVLMAGFRAGSQLEVEKPSFFVVLDTLTDEFLDMIDQDGGPAALFQLYMMLMKSNEFEAKHFCDFVLHSARFARVFGMTELAPFAPDNESLRASPDIDRFAHNVVNPGLSRKLFNPGRNQGYLVYGLGRPRVLVSLPFKEGSEYTYDVYSNSIDVATSLGMRGYFGSLLMFDYLAGLDTDFEGLPSWLVFFSCLATNADAVVFVTEGEKGLTNAQKLEAAYTPDRVPKKIVQLEDDELRWAKHDGAKLGLEVKHVLPGRGIVSAEQAMADEARHARPMIEGHLRGNFPTDRLIVIGDDAILEVFPDGRRVQRSF